MVEMFEFDLRGWISSDVQVEPVSGTFACTVTEVVSITVESPTFQS